MGQVWANSEQLNLTLDYFAGNASNEPSVVDMPSSLSGREKEIAGLLMRGSSNKEIARALHISERTVKNHMGNIFEKIGVNGRVQAVLRLVGGI
jgi:DNA-binding CsgD family transcriptional regulator